MALEMEQKLMEEPNPIGEEEQVNDKLPGTAIQIESEDDEVSIDEDKTPKSLPKAVLLVLLFNVFLIVAAIPVYLYFHTQNEGMRQRVLDFLIVGGALVAIPLLYCMGDLSEGRPNFYYI